MQRKTVASAIIASVGYDATTSVLEVEFRNGWIYEYDGVPEFVYYALMKAPSHGHYLKQNIVDTYVTRRTR